MKALSKPLSSPGRPDKFPPPLMRFLRSNVGSRSRGRSRSSPIFYLRSKKRPPGGVIETTQEPSSPKVTCIGQVRVRRKKNAAANRRRRRGCLWLNRTPFRCGFPKKPFGRIFRNWNLIFRSNCCRDGGVAEVDNFRVGEKTENHAVAGDNNNNSNYNYNNNKNRNSVSSSDSETDFYRRNKDEENAEDVFGESKMEFLESSSSSSPPKNALLLTRCRSAPYRSSSLGGRFWAEEKLGEINGGDENEGKEESEKPRCEENSSSSNNREMEKKFEELKVKNRGIAVHPLLLTRCKSEPARKGERLVITEEKANFLMQTRLEDVISQHNNS